MTGDMTMSVHSGNDSSGPSVRTPITMANSYHLPDNPETLDWSGTEQLFYTRNSGANQVALQTKLAAMEHAEDAVVLASGVAALHAVFFTLLRTGDHVVVSDTTYEATWKLWSRLLPEKYGIEATFVDVTDSDAVRAAFRPNTRMMIVEAIANPTTKIADIAALAAVTHDADALLVVDSTFTPPPLYRPLADGADLVVHSLTKYINGHGDAMGGAILGRTELLDPIRAQAMVDVGGVISPFNAWLIARGSITLPLRLRQHQNTAATLAQFLAEDERIAYVAYPGLASHPQHDLATRQFGGRGHGAMMAFAVRGDSATQNRFVSHLQIVTSAVSLGHDESLIVHVGTDGPRVAAYPDEFRRWGHLRFSVGLEDADDLRADLSAALDRTFAAG
ncbi:Cystathionine gamma-lyase [Gordonia bronchialis DSM 43247]|uniref:homocysteine desulfhydrase n=1 Tax=Gordonia bronchialis (strain ATCC 25592 / DSM 43247 / BCRC 13721 / JCM 3198 / KCTC 3076 / NBRC 16047 / NCTC 10667) TaxID=526226 RepID=D0L9Q1_GORB4|nr:aminotransferase class I/II-fold pyridoxal phosphate-dependent enzyme [Gordonia bronchialis]ACY21239.1 Cystathionine gamma-lyase [Gordonia bronchialis DSM 43247]MCC3324023.1 aminotransferase class I/II-fold pyridoxal phosphate-dependent enzyme [Gordonia bronchialis]QGS25073.1 aminotransferase class V-fold PLP-dependent enzyme [Gordonia bronchialis]UAK38651.1 aminotransferase class I/II-fold pyridoxal phosphate-dependent enzyme [Gordonia bronchialis]STQ64110.1 Methionine gamma-lyase [Gordoni